MLEKYRKLILSQIAAIMAFGAFFVAYLSQTQTGSWTDGRTLSFLGFGVLLFAIETRLIFSWIAAKKTAQQVEQ